MEKNIEKTRAFCWYPFKHVKINSNGEVQMCCYQSGSIGNVLTQSFEEIWNSELAKQIREFTLRSEMHPMCKGWGGCSFINTDITKNHIDITHHKYLPTSVEIDLPSKHCNIGGENPDDKNPACIMCPRNFEKFRTDPSFSLDNTIKIAESLKYLMPNMESFSVLGVAEPFWRNIIFDIFDILEFKNYKEKIFFWTFTNGSVFDNETQNKFLKYTENSEIRCSIDAGSKETYIKIRRRNFFETIIKNLSDYAVKRQENQKLSIFNNINKLNVHEMHLMVDVAREVWADELWFNPTHNAGGNLDSSAGLLIEENDLNLFIDNQKRAEERAKELGVTLKMYRDFKQVIAKEEIIDDNKKQLVQIKL
jgi:MoaA/NifB/PqqE/SkfB family radical SAM enzyme